MRHSSSAVRRHLTTMPAAVAAPDVAATDSSCNDSGISGASGCASPTQQQQPLLTDGWQFHSMAMSAISELPSPLMVSSAISATPSPTAASGSAASSSRLTQSVSYGRGASAQSRRQALAHSLAMLRHETRTRQLELDKREREVQEATAKATEQIEYVLKMADKAHKLEDENAQLRGQLDLCKSEIGSLLDELQQREAELQERDDYCQELRQQLGRSRQDIAQIRSCADQLKVEKSVLSDTCRAAERLQASEAEAAAAAESEQLRLANQRLQRQLAQADSETSALLTQIQQLQQQIQQQQQQQQQAAVDQSGGDSRSKRELLQTIRRLVEEKMVWEAYCARLLRRAVECAPQLLLARPSSDEESAESRWEAAFGALFRAVMQKDPRLAEGFQHPGSPPPRSSLQPTASRPPRASTSSSTSAGSSSSTAAAPSATSSTMLRPRPILQPTMRSARPPAPRQLKLPSSVA